VIRVFPKRNSYTPDDEYCFFDVPGLFIPEHDEVHICCVFTWDIPHCEYLKRQWEAKTNKPVLIGGPAYDDAGGDFIPGMYIDKGIVFTSRGCPNNCSFCAVPRREGALRELPIVPGNIIQDNNFLACSKEHRQKVYEMLKTQKKIQFKGGLEVAILSDWDIEQMRLLNTKGSVNELWLACDTKGKISLLKQACERLHAAGFNQEKIRCYALIGDDMRENENRLRQIFLAGALPFAQLYQPFELKKKIYSKQWEDFQRIWQRPAATKAHMKEVIEWIIRKKPRASGL
jgi:hypothetical protein